MFSRYLAVYRVCFVVTLFFLLMSLVMLGVRTSRDPRSGIQNGFWGLKYVLVIAGVIAAFFIPQGGFGTTWMYFGMVGGFVFILVQLVLIVDFAHRFVSLIFLPYLESPEMLLILAGLNRGTSSTTRPTTPTGSTPSWPSPPSSSPW